MNMTVPMLACRAGKMSIFSASALFEAIAADDMAALEALIKAGVHLAARNDEREPPLYAAAEKGSAGVLAALLAGGCDPRLRTPNGETAVHAAAMRGEAGML